MSDMHIIIRDGAHQLDTFSTPPPASFEVQTCIFGRDLPFCFLLQNLHYTAC